MHRIIKSYMNTFIEENSVNHGLAEDKQFEMFANYCVIRSFYPEDFDPDAITSDEIDAGIDGICFLIDGEIVSSVDEAEDIFKRPQKNIPVVIYFMQAKSGDAYDRGEILKFGNGVVDFVSEHSKLPHGDFLEQKKKIYNLLLDNVSKIQNGRADICLKYITNSNNPIAKEIIATKELIIKDLQTTGFFTTVSFDYIGLEQIISLWDRTRNSITAIIPTKQLSPYPAMPGISEAYIAIVPLREFVEKIFLRKM